MDTTATASRPRKYIHHVTFRLDDQQASLAADLRNTFDGASWAEVGRYLFSDPVIVERLHARIRGER